MSLVSSPFFLAQSAATDVAGQSLRFEDGDSAYMTHTPTTAGNRRTWTFSTWIKRGNITSNQGIFGAESSGDRLVLGFGFSGSDQIRFYCQSPSTDIYTSAVLRDPSAWYNIVWAVDTTQATSTDRIKIYVNGEQITSFASASYPAQNSDYSVNNTVTQYIGRWAGYAGEYLDGYLANVCLIDGQQLDPTSFGEYDDTLWKPKSDTAIQSLTFGTNGFYLPFKQTTEAEGFSTVTYTGNGGTQSIEGVGFEPDLIWGKRRNSTNSHWLVDSVRGAGKRIISNSTVAEDTPTGLQSSFDSNGFTVGSNTECNASGSPYVAWAWDAGDNLAPTGFSAVTYTGNGSRQSINGLGFEPDLVWIKSRNAARSHGLFDSVRGASKGLTSEATNSEYTSSAGNDFVSFDSNGFTVGTPQNFGSTNTNGDDIVAWCWDAGSGSPVSNTDGSITSTVKANSTAGFSIATYTGNGTSGSTFGHGLGVTPDLVIVKRRNTTAPWNVYTSVTGETKYLELDSTAAVATATNRWNDTAPTSSVVTIGNTNNVNGSGSTYVAYSFASISGYSKVSSYTGTGTADLAVTGLGFRPAVVIIKRTDSTDRWLITDSTRTPLGDTEGTNIFLDANNAESGSSTTAMTFDSDGFTLNGTNGMINASGGTYVYIAFAGGQDLISPVNTNGTITSRVKANTAKGFSIVSYTGTGSNATVGHGLSSAPEMIILKNRTSALGWPVYHSANGATKFMQLEITNAVQTASTVWQDTAPTSSVFSVGTSTYVNQSSSEFIAYCFQSVSGYSSIGSYTGTGSAGNSITGLGFKPAWVMVKRTDNTSNWSIYDNTRTPINPRNLTLSANLSNAEVTSTSNVIDFDNDGFTLLGTGTTTNASGGTYIYMAFADTRDATFFGDTSGNGNNWTPNALKNTDVVPDSPVTGGNFATLNPIQSLYSNSVTTFSEGNLKAALGNASNWRSAVATQQHSSGKWYYEVYANQGANGFIGFGHDNFDINGAAAYAGATAGSWGWLVSGGLYNNTASIDTLSSYTTGDIISIALDFDNAKAYWAKNGIWENSADPAAGTGGTSIDADKLYKMGFSNVSGYASTANFGQDSSFAGNETPQGNTDDNGVGDFYYAPPSGFLALTTGNLPAATITAPDEYFNTVLYTGTGSSQSITGVNFQPDWIWWKGRNASSSHLLMNAVVGNTKYLYSNSTAAEQTDGTNVLTSFDSDGFTLPADTGGYANFSGRTYVAWNWLGGNSTSSNTDGSITSTVSANQTAGFSVVSYTGTGSVATVGHGLSSAPEIIIPKNRDYVSGTHWDIYASPIGAGNILRLNSTLASTASATNWNSTAPTSSVFTVGTSNSTNRSGDGYIAYCFHSVEGYSKIGSYTGNGSTDGTFVHCGFRPAWVMVKRTDSAADWLIFDAKRDIDNEITKFLYPNLSNAEATGSGVMDFLSNGFKLRGSTANRNASGGSYIFLAFAEAPFKSANAR